MKPKIEIDCADPLLAMRRIEMVLRSKKNPDNKEKAITEIVVAFKTAVEIKRASGKEIFIGGYLK